MDFYKDGLDSLESERKSRILKIEDDEEVKVISPLEAKQLKKLAPIEINKIFDTSFRTILDGLEGIIEIDKKIMIDIDWRAIEKIIDISKGCFGHRTIKIIEEEEDCEEEEEKCESLFDVFSKPIEIPEDEEIPEEIVMGTAFRCLAQLLSEQHLVKFLENNFVINDMLERIHEETAIVGLTNYASHRKTYRNNVLGFGVYETIIEIISTQEEGISFSVLCEFAATMFKFDFVHEFIEGKIEDYYREQSFEIFQSLWVYYVYDSINNDDRRALLKVWKTILNNQGDYDDVAFINEASDTIMGYRDDSDIKYTRRCCKHFITLMKRDDLTEANQHLLENDIWGYSISLLLSDIDEISCFGATLIQEILVYFHDVVIEKGLLESLCEDFYKASFNARKVIAQAVSLFILNCETITSFAETADYFILIASPGIEPEERSFVGIAQALVRLAETSHGLGKPDIKEFIDTDSEYRLWIKDSYDEISSPDFGIGKDPSIVETACSEVLRWLITEP